MSAPAAMTMTAPPPPTPPHEGHHDAAGTDAGVVYTCPMHSDVHSATPGTCPVCGMTLVPQKP
jgi:hypothetical protein